jgi:glycosyltransferase involved in cell wall biosynthesis
MEDIAPRLASWVNDRSTDVYVISVSAGAAWVALPLLKPQIATVGIAHTDSETFYGPMRHYGKLLSAVVAVSRQIAHRLTDGCGIDSSKVVHIPHGVKGIESEGELKGRLEESSRPPLRLIFVGRLEQPQKRIFDLVAVVKRLVRLGVDFTLDMVGDGPESDEVKRALSEETRKSIVVFHGWLPVEEVISKLRRADVFVLTSAYEGFPVALLEAMANGVVPLVTDIESGHRELISHGVSGFLAPGGDTEVFAQLIEGLSRDRELLEQLRIKAWETGRRYSVENMASGYASLFEKLSDAPADEVGRPAPNYPLMPSCRSRYPLWLRRM